MKAYKIAGSISSFFYSVAKYLSRLTSCTSHSVTAAAAQEEEFTGSYSFNLTVQSREELNKKGFLESPVFDVGGYDWSLRYYPGVNARLLSARAVFLYLKSKEDNVKARLTFNFLDKDGTQICSRRITEWRTYSNNTLNVDWGFSSTEGKPLPVDCHAIKCTVTVVRGSLVESTGKLVVPPSIIHNQLGHLLETGNGADVTFVVNKQYFSGHKCILAARSPVFAAQFFGQMKEKLDTVIKIEEMEAPVFKALLHFIYNGSLPGFEGIKGSQEKHDSEVIMAQHLLVAADRYSLDRLKVICEKILCGSIDKSNVVVLLSLAERHSCNHLKTICLKILATPETIGEVVETEEFQCLVRSRPLILKELLVEQGRN